MPARGKGRARRRDPSRRPPVPVGQEPVARRQAATILHLMESLGIDSADIGLPGAGPHVVATVTRLAREIVDAKMKLRPNCAARTVAADILPIIEISQKVGIPIEVACFIGSSPDPAVRRGLGPRPDAAHDRGGRLAGGPGRPSRDVRHRGHDARAPGPHPPDVHDRDPSRGAARLRLRHGRPRDAQRRPEPDPVRLAAWSPRSTPTSRWTGTATRTGASASPTPSGLSRPGRTACMPARSASASASGNTPMDQLLVNLQLLGWIDRDLSKLHEYCAVVSRRDRRSDPRQLSRSSAATPSARARESTPPPSSRPARRATSGWRTGSTRAFPPRWSADGRRSRSAR